MMKGIPAWVYAFVLACAVLGALVVFAGSAVVAENEHQKRRSLVAFIQGPYLQSFVLSKKAFPVDLSGLREFAERQGNTIAKEQIEKYRPTLVDVQIDENGYSAKIRMMDGESFNIRRTAGSFRTDQEALVRKALKAQASK